MIDEKLRPWLRVCAASFEVRGIAMQVSTVIVLWVAYVRVLEATTWIDVVEHAHALPIF